MKKIRQLAVVIALLFITVFARADEGMWLLSLLDGYTIEDMQSKGFKLSAEDIYSVNQACLKDAVVIFGGGCTGEMISGDGLVLTNHHCGYGAIQSHSSVENDYLTNGFWAMSRDEELPNSRLSVQFLRYMKDVGEDVLLGTETVTETKERQAIINRNIKGIVDEATKENNLIALVRPMFYGNQYFLFVYERFNDVRLVGAPPSSIGNFGEDTDNWIWPRHTGDFSLFRVYADKDNKPVSYSTENVPYKPKKFFEIAMDGIDKGDFTMVLGYPGTTRQFLYSGEIKNMMESTLPMRIDIRTRRLDIMDKYMKQSDKVRIQYASKYRGVSNGWKKWQGAVKGLERLDAVKRKIEFEDDFRKWVSESSDRQEKYGNLLENFEEIYGELEEYVLTSELLSEAIFSVEIFKTASSVYSMMLDSVPSEDISGMVSGLFKDYYLHIDREMFAEMMQYYRDHAIKEYMPDIYSEIDKKFNGDIDKYAEKLFATTRFYSAESVAEIIDLYSKKPLKAIKKLENDPVLAIFNQFRTIYFERILPQNQLFNNNLDELYKTWVKARFEMLPDVRHYPDANFTMRLTYGEVDGYTPEDAVIYDYYTTLGGVIEKSREEKPDYIVPDKLVELYESKDFGDYGVNGTMPVCFAASNHTSGGNSGSPVIDANGRLIGLNFDRNWHGTMSDEMYDPNMCRNISVDIRYVLFIIDKFADAGYLLNEMVLVKEGDQMIR